MFCQKVLVKVFSEIMLTDPKGVSENGLPNPKLISEKWSSVGNISVQCQLFEVQNTFTNISLMMNGVEKTEFCRVFLSSHFQRFCFKLLSMRQKRLCILICKLKSF